MSYLKIQSGYENVMSGSSELAKRETNDCVVRAFASAANIAYEVSHKFCEEVFKRESKKGVKTYFMAAQLLRAEEDGLKIGNKEYSVKVLGRSDTMNKYKLHGEIIFRQKTLKSFIQSHMKGTYIVCVANHAICIKDGELIDWNNLSFKPTRKVLKAYKLEEKVKYVQLSLF